MKRLYRSAGASIKLTLCVSLAVCPGCAWLKAEPDVVLVVIDSLRRDHLGSFGYARDTSPRMDQLFAEGVLFTNVLSVTSHTVPAVVSLLTGRYPTETGVRYYGKNRSFDGKHSVVEMGPSVPEELDLLSEVFQARGYRTAAVVSNPWLTRDAGFAQGFDHFIQIECVGLPGSGLPPCVGQQVLERAKPLLASHAKPLFLYLHLMDVHYPYLKKGLTKGIFVKKRGEDRYKNGLVKLTDVDRKYMVALYDEGILYLDAVIGRMSDMLDATQRDTVLIITTDHGEEFHDHGGLGHGRSLYGEVVDSFLYIRRGDDFPIRRIDQPLSIVDLAPTLFDLVGFDDVDERSGESFLGLLRGEDRHEERSLFMDLGQIRAVVRGPWKLIAHEDGRSELYHVADDPAELQDRSRQEKAIRDELIAQLEERLGHTVAPEPKLREIDLDSLERLRSLGYVE